MEGPEYAKDFQGFLSSLSSVDLASKARLLQSLSSFLLCVAKSLSASLSRHSAYALVEKSKVSLRQTEVFQLQDFLFKELVNHTHFLFTESGTGDELSNYEVEGKRIALSEAGHLELVSQTLRCCIRVLPLLDWFDTGASFIASMTLDHIIQQLCSPSKLYALLGLSGPHGVQFSRRSWTAKKIISHELQRGGCGTDVERFELGSSSVEDSEAGNSTFCTAAPPTSHVKLNVQHRIQIICAALEVYMDELLLRPDLSSLFLNAQENMDWRSKRDSLALYSRHTELSLEAAFVHVLLSSLSRCPAQAILGTVPVREGKILTCNLSLPAGILLLDSSTLQEVPKTFLAHVAHLVARSFNEESFIFPTPSDESRREESHDMKMVAAKGSNWSFSSQGVITNFDTVNSNSVSTLFPYRLTLGLACSVLETGMQLYGKFSCASKVLYEHEERTNYEVHLNCPNPVIRSCLSKYKDLCAVVVKKPSNEVSSMLVQESDTYLCELMSRGCDCHYCSSQARATTGGEGPCYDANKTKHCTFDFGEVSCVSEQEEVSENSSLVAALLHLMSCAVRCILRGLSNSLGTISTVQLKGESTAAQLKSDYASEVLHNMGVIFHQYIPASFSVSGKCRKSHYIHLQGKESLTKVGDKGGLPSNSFMAQAIVFFANVLRVEISKGAPVVLLKEYLEFLESLLALIIFQEEKMKWNDGIIQTSKSGSGDVRNCRGSATKPYLQSHQSSQPYEGCQLHNVVKTDDQQAVGSTASVFLRAMGFSFQSVPLDCLIRQNKSIHFIVEATNLSHDDVNNDTISNQRGGFQDSPVSSIEEQTVVATGCKNTNVQFSSSDLINIQSCLEGSEEVSEESIETLAMVKQLVAATSTSDVQATPRPQTRSVMSLTTGMSVVDHVESVVSPILKPLAKNHASFKTLAIINRLAEKQMQWRRQGDTLSGGESRCTGSLQRVSCKPRQGVFGDAKRKKRIHADVSETAEDAEGLSCRVNPFIQAILHERNQLKDNENLDDLDDFVVCKKGRDYTLWRKNRYKSRRRLHNRLILKRMEEKMELLHSLSA